MAETLLIHIVWHFMVLQTEVTAIIGRMKILKRFLTSSPYKITMEKRATKQLSSSGNSYVNPRLFLRPDHIWRSSFHLSMLPLQFFTNLCPLAAMKQVWEKLEELLPALFSRCTEKITMRRLQRGQMKVIKTQLLIKLRSWEIRAVQQFSSTSTSQDFDIKHYTWSFLPHAVQQNRCNLFCIAI